MISERSIYTGLVLPGQAMATPAGLARLQRDGLFEEGVFAYGRRYLTSPDTLALNPAYLPLRVDLFNLPRIRLRDGGALNLTLKDALPDAWGRLVLQARNNWQELDDVDVLLQTNADRVGAMVFAEQPAMEQVELAVASFRLEELAEAAHKLEFDMEIPPSMRRLLNQGGSLGGAHPKASLVKDHTLWIAKFPAKDDEVDVQMLEACTLTLASRCGISVPTFELAPLGRIHALLLRRFDRPGNLEAGHRIHYLSAAAFTDSPYTSDAGSYVKLAQHIRRFGSHVAEDLPELFRRMVFNILVDNTDDHVKNHGVLHTGSNHYRLAPAFDLVPQLTNLGYMGMAVIDGKLNASLDLTLEQARHFGLAPDQAKAVITQVSEGVRNWRPLFESMGADAALLRRVEACFQRQERIANQ